MYQDQKCTNLTFCQLQCFCKVLHIFLWKPYYYSSIYEMKALDIKLTNGIFSCSFFYASSKQVNISYPPWTNSLGNKSLHDILSLTRVLLLWDVLLSSFIDNIMWYKVRRHISKSVWVGKKANVLKVDVSWFTVVIQFSCRFSAKTKRQTSDTNYVCWLTTFAGKYLIIILIHSPLTTAIPI